MNFLNALGINAHNYGASTGLKWMNTDNNGQFDISSPADGSAIASVYQCSNEDYEQVIATAQEAFKTWRKVPAPNRGEIVRLIGNKLRDFKQPRVPIQGVARRDRLSSPPGQGASPCRYFGGRLDTMHSIG